LIIDSFSCSELKEIEYLNFGESTFVSPVPVVIGNGQCFTDNNNPLAVVNIHDITDRVMIRVIRAYLSFLEKEID
jgi:hypothetical protein